MTLKIQKVIRLLTTIAMFAFNIAAAWLPINGLSTKELSDMLPTLITPAGFTFAIWSLIYLGLIIVGVLFFLDRIKLPKNFVTRYSISALANGLRIVVRHYQNLHLSMLIILVLLVSLIVIDQIIKNHAGSLGHYHLVRNIFLLYFGRVQIATLLMTTIYFTYQWKWIDNQNITWAVIVIALAGISNLLIIWKERNIVTSVVALWALRGIMNGQTNPIIIQTCRMVFAVLAANVLVFALKRYGKNTYS